MAPKKLLADACEKERAPRALKRRTTEEQVQRLIKDSFSHMSHEDVFAVKKDGKTLKECLVSEKAEVG